MKFEDAVIGREIATGFGLLQGGIIKSVDFDTRTVNVQQWHEGKLLPATPLDETQMAHWIQANDPIDVLKSKVDRAYEDVKQAIEQYEIDSAREKQGEL